jgi:hypothetical protein
MAAIMQRRKLLGPTVEALAGGRDCFRTGDPTMTESMSQMIGDWQCGQCGTPAKERPGRVEVSQYTLTDVGKTAPPAPVPYCPNPQCPFFDAIIPNFNFESRSRDDVSA